MSARRRLVLSGVRTAGTGIVSLLDTETGVFRCTRHSDRCFQVYWTQGKVFSGTEGKGEV